MEFLHIVSSSPCLPFWSQGRQCHGKRAQSVRAMQTLPCLCRSLHSSDFDHIETTYANGTEVTLPVWKLRMAEFYRDSTTLGRTLNVSKCTDQKLETHC